MMGAVNLHGQPVLFACARWPEVPAREIAVRLSEHLVVDWTALVMMCELDGAAARLLWRG